MTITEIIPGLFVGGNVSLQELTTVSNSHNIASVLSIGPAPTPYWSKNRFKRSIAAGRLKWIEYEPQGCSTENLLHSMDSTCEFIEKMLWTRPGASCSPTAENRKGCRSDQPEYLTISDKLTRRVRPKLPTKEDFWNWYAVPMLRNFEDSKLWNKFMNLEPPLDLQQFAKNPLYTVLVQCDEGISASPAIIVAYIMRKQKLTLFEALLKIAVRVPEVKIHDNLVGQLGLWEEMGYTKWFDRKALLIQSRYQAFLIAHYDFLKARGFTLEQICQSMRYRRYIPCEKLDGLKDPMGNLENRLRLIPDEEPKKLLMDRRAARWNDADLDEDQNIDRGKAYKEDIFSRFEAIAEERESHRKEWMALRGDDRAC